MKTRTPMKPSGPVPTEVGRLIGVHNSDDTDYIRLVLDIGIRNYSSLLLGIVCPYNAGTGACCPGSSSIQGHWFLSAEEWTDS